MIAWLSVALLALLSHASSEAPPTLVLSGEWLFHRGDQAEWAHPGWDASEWERIPVPGGWEAVAEGYDGYAWYRREIRLPAEMGAGPVGLRFGSVGDVFEAYWNGVSIGGRGRFPPDFREGVTPALLFVPTEALEASTDGTHLLAVRVYNHYAYGGLLGGARVGRYDALASMDHPREITIVALVVLFLAIGAYHFAFYLGRRPARENLYFALVCALAALYGATSGLTFAEATIEVINPYRVRLLAMVLAGPVYLALLARLFDLRIGSGGRVVVLFFLFLVPLVAFLPLDVLSVLHRWIGLVVGAGLVTTSVWAWARGYTRGTHARVMMLGTIAFSATVGYDLLSDFGFVPVAHVLPGVPGLFWLGFVLFLGAIGTQTAGRFARAEADAGTDPLTGLARRHVFEEALAREAERRRRAGGPILVAVLDLDRFKLVNDTYGHRAGDVVLDRVGHLLRHSARSIDLPARLGGEEFAVLLADTDEAGAMAFAERFRQRLRELQVAVPGGEVGGMTVSVGIVVSGGWIEAAALLDEADRAMYRAKQGGRDRVVVTRVAGAGAAG